VLNNGISWQRVVCLVALVASALVAYVIGAKELSWALGGGAVLSFPVGKLAHRHLSSDPRAIGLLQEFVEQLRERTGPSRAEMVSDDTARIVLDAIEGRPSRPPPKRPGEYSVHHRRKGDRR